MKKQTQNLKSFLTSMSIVLLLSGCSIYHINSEDISTDFFPSKNSANDVAYLEEIDNPFEIIGYVTINTERNQRINEVVEKMKHEAAILGGDAITNIQTDATGSWKRLPVQNFVGNGYVRANFKASVIVFK